jgi:hypothetical protein
VLYMTQERNFKRRLVVPGSSNYMAISLTTFVILYFMSWHDYEQCRLLRVARLFHILEFRICFSACALKTE